MPAKVLVSWYHNFQISFQYEALHISKYMYIAAIVLMCFTTTIFLHGESKVGLLSLRIHSWDRSDAHTQPQPLTYCKRRKAGRGLGTRLASFSVTFFASRTAGGERCRSGLAMRLRVGPLSCTIQLSQPLGWVRRSTCEATIQINSLPCS